jgi:hypothetical protein
MANFADLANGFGVVTVMNACIYKLKSNYSYVGRGACAHAANAGGALTADMFECTGLYLDTLKIANLTQEGPTKTVTGGQYANPLIKYGKTMTMEMQDALGRAAVMKEFFGCEIKEGRISVTDKFPGAFAIEGDSFFIDQQTGDKVDVHIFIPQFLPDGIFNLTQDSEGDATVFDLNGSISVTKISDEEGPRDIFYEIRDTAFFATTPKATGENDYHQGETSDLNAIKNNAVATYNRYCAALGADPADAQITAINAATNEAGVKNALHTAMQDVDVPST